MSKETVLIVSPPRSDSTAVQIGLAQSGNNRQVHEPFHHGKRKSFEQGWQTVATQLETMDDGLLIIKDLAKYISLEEWQKLMPLLTGVIFLVREPTVQFNSLLERRVNDRFVDRDADVLSKDEIKSYITQLPESDWRDPSWQHLDQFLDIMEATPDTPYAIVSALSLQFIGREAIHRLAKRLGWQGYDEYSFDEVWLKCKGQDFYNPPFLGQEPQTVEDYKKSAWLKEAVSSRCLQPLNRQKDRVHSISQYPQLMQNYLLEEVLPVYVRFLMHEACVSRPNLYYWLMSQDYRLVGINLIEAYVVTHSWANDISCFDDDKPLALCQLEDVIPKKEEALCQLEAEIADRLERRQPEIFDRLNNLVHQYEPSEFEWIPLDLYRRVKANIWSAKQG
jgi:hypothetical protein